MAMFARLIRGLPRHVRSGQQAVGTHWVRSTTVTDARCFSKQSDPYADGKYEHSDGSPVDITSRLTKGVSGATAGYRDNWDNVFGGDGSGGTSSSEAKAKVEEAYQDKDPEVGL